MIRPAKQPWISSPIVDSIFILLPPFLSLLVVALLPPTYKATGSMPLWGWLILVLLIDVAHVYSTLYRTYFDKQRFKKQRNLFILVPVVCYSVAILLYLANSLLFWRILAYAAVFHFIRQQYGFMRLYSRTEAKPLWMRRLDTMTVYSATLYPLVYWHTTPGRNFSWFVEGDFLQINAHALNVTALGIYLAILLAYIVKEIIWYHQRKTINVPRNVLIAGTALSWYFGIVYFNGDMAFTLLNVVSHGIPYMALIWITTEKESRSQKDTPNPTKSIRNYGLLVFMLLIISLAYIEEGFWDGLVWREHGEAFGLFQQLPVVANEYALAFLIPLLSLPQMTHYVLDGFIWRRKDD